ncbi:LemA family protein [Alkanindiges sp. WGS2144]|uniref:LemA family protein n=1 Tax=Alkanindiges sp. WGS2144 TaxID=3366808 RepID=UPI003752CDD3
MWGGVVFIAIILAGVFYIIALFNGLVAKRNAARNGFSQIDVQLQRRHDLIPNLVEATRAYMSHEKDTLERVIGARDAAVQAQRNLANAGVYNSPELVDKLALAEQRLSNSLAQFTAVMEQYPELKADSVVKELMEELNSTENRVSFARQAYNDQVMFYNNACEMFPSNFVAGAFSFKPMKLLALDDAKAVGPPVRISL